MTGEKLCAAPEQHLRMLQMYICRDVPIILSGYGGVPFGEVVGYEQGGQVLLYMTGDNIEPQRLALDEAMTRGSESLSGWVFVGGKKERKSLRDIYRSAVYALPNPLSTQADTHCFGGYAFRAWADEIENGRFAYMQPEAFDSWHMYSVYVCCLATNSGGCRGFLNKAQELNPDFGFLDNVKKQYRMTGLLWNQHHEANDGFAEAYARGRIARCCRTTWKPWAAASTSRWRRCRISRSDPESWQSSANAAHASTKWLGF